MARDKTGKPQPGIAARFEGVCQRCFCDIRLGQRIVFVRGSAIHVKCASGQDDR